MGHRGWANNVLTQTNATCSGAIVTQTNQGMTERVGIDLVYSYMSYKKDYISLVILSVILTVIEHLKPPEIVKLVCL